MCRVMEEMCREENRKGRMETAQRMLSIGKLTLEEIAECASLTLEEVKRLADALPR